MEFRLLNSAFAVGTLWAALAACAGQPPQITATGAPRGSAQPKATATAGTPVADGEATQMEFIVDSEAFEDGEAVPRKYSCDGDDISPPLRWTGIPPGTQALAVVLDDPDAPAGTWVHWVVFDIPATSGGLQEGIPPDPELAGGGRHGSNSWGRPGYGGPCPPSGVHRYFFRVYALDSALDLEPGATKEQVLAAMENHVLDSAELMGTYAR